VAVPVTAVLLVLVAGGVLWPLTPSVADAGRRVAAIDAAHGGTRATALPVPDRVGQALVATEDSRFWSTPGVDPVAVARVVWSTVRGAGDTGGAGLAQQLAKNLYQLPGPAVRREVEQVELAVKLEATYPKRDILRMYLSAVYYGHGFYGIDQAARGYFGRTPAQLTWGQAALLAGVVQAPSDDDPLLHPARATARQHHVLRRLVATGVLDAGQARAIAARGLQLR
jgi:penicillin-binding protein 1A